MDARLVADHRVAIDHEEFLLRIGAAEHIDQHAAELAGSKIRLPRRHFGIGRKFRRGERAQQRRRLSRIDLLVLLDGADRAVERQYPGRDRC